MKIKHQNNEFGVGDKVSVIQKIREGDKERTQIFEGMVIAIKNRGNNKSFTVRKIGVHNIGIERIFLLQSPFIEKVKIIKKGTRGVRRSKLYYTRGKSPTEVEEIYTRAFLREKRKKKNVSSRK